MKNEIVGPTDLESEKILSFEKTVQSEKDKPDNPCFNSFSNSLKPTFRFEDIVVFRNTSSLFEKHSGNGFLKHFPTVSSNTEQRVD